MLQTQFILDDLPSHCMLLSQLQLGARDGIIVSLFTLFPVDDIPDLIEVLIT